MPSGLTRLSTCSAAGPICAEPDHVETANIAPQRMLRRELCATPDLTRTAQKLWRRMKTD